MVEPAHGAGVRPLDVPSHLPLVVDIDGTLLRGDLAAEAWVRLARRAPRRMLALLVRWLTFGRLEAKLSLADEPAAHGPLPGVRASLLARLRVETAAGRRVIVATGAPRPFAERALRELGLEEVELLAPDASTPMTGDHKAGAILVRAPKGYLYAGDARIDRVVWSHAEGAIMAGRAYDAWAGATPILERHLDRSIVVDIVAALRPTAAIAKSSLAFIPAIAAHELAALVPSIGAAVATAIAAAAVYVANDIADLDEDRRSSRHLSRPIPAGTLPLRFALIAAPLLALNALIVSVVAGAVLPIACYLALSFAYVTVLRNAPPADIGAIAGLHGLRIAAGAVAAGIAISPWLAGAALLTFASIGIAKRASDLVAGRERSGYRVSDLPFVAAFGGATAIGAVVVALLYAASENAALLYPSGSAWAIGPLLLFVMGRLWFRSLRGEVSGDPLINGLRDRANWVAAVAAAAIFLAAGAL